MPSDVWLVTARKNGYRVPDGSFEDVHRRREICICVWGVPILQHHSLKGVFAKFTIWSSIVRISCFTVFTLISACYEGSLLKRGGDGHICS